MLGDTARLVVLADHEAGDVLQEQQRDAALVAQLDEVGALLGRFGEQDAVVGDDPDRVAVDPGEAGDQGLPELGLELREPGAVGDARDDLAYVVGGAGVRGDGAVEAVGVDLGLHGGPDGPGQRPARGERGGDVPHDPQGVGVVLGEVVGDAGDPGVHLAAAEAPPR